MGCGASNGEAFGGENPQALASPNSLGRNLLTDELNNSYRNTTTLKAYVLEEKEENEDEYWL